MKNIDLSIIVPVYNGEKTIENTIKSIICQKVDGVFEVIIINDGSNDNTDYILRNLVEKYDNIKYISIHNSGVSEARNIGIENANGRYLMFVDSDDMLESNSIQIMLNNIVKYDLIIAGYKRIGKKNTVEKKIDSRKYERNQFGEMIESCQENNLFNQIWNKIYKLSIIKNFEIKFDINQSLGEDLKFNLDYLKNIEKVNVISQCIYDYDNSETGLNHKYRRDRLKLNLENIECLETYFENNKFEMKYIYRKYTITIISGINNICKNKNRDEKKKDLIELCNNKIVKEKLEKDNRFIANLVLSMLKTNNFWVICFFAFNTKIAETLYKKIKLGY